MGKAYRNRTIFYMVSATYSSFCVIRSRDLEAVTTEAHLSPLCLCGKKPGKQPQRHGGTENVKREDYKTFSGEQDSAILLHREPNLIFETGQKFVNSR